MCRDIPCRALTIVQDDHFGPSLSCDADHLMDDCIESLRTVTKRLNLEDAGMCRPMESNIVAGRSERSGATSHGFMVGQFRDINGDDPS